MIHIMNHIHISTISGSGNLAPNIGHGLMVLRMQTIQANTRDLLELLLEIILVQDLITRWPATLFRVL